MMKPDLHQLTLKIRESPVLKDIPEEQLMWLVENSEYITLKEGDYLFRTGDPVDKMVVFLEGSISYNIQQQNGNLKTLDEVHTGEVTGALPYSRANTAIADARVVEGVEALCLPKEHFKEMILNHYELTESLVHIMTTRVREFTRAQQQSEKMAALGKLSAGLAHELNNPASAVVRSSASLKKLLSSITDAFQQLLLTKPSPEVFNLLQELSTQEEPKDKPKSLSLLDRSARIDKQASWLEAHGLTNAYETAEAFSESGVNLEKLQRLEKEQKLNKEQLSALLNWVSTVLSMSKLTEEIQFSSKRISELVQAVKSYSHMDRSPEKEITDLKKVLVTPLSCLILR